MTQPFSRRKFIKSSALVSTAFLGLKLYSCTPGNQQQKADFNGYGPLLDDPEGILRLPKGFSYRIISRMGTPMADGLISPGKHDAMATFDLNGKTAIVRNHEVSPHDMKSGPFGAANELLRNLQPEMVYDFGKGEVPCLGGTTTLIYDEKSGVVEKEFMSLAGTIRNCAGGPTPWDTWISCEENVSRKGDMDGRLEKDHGYNFEVKVSEEPVLNRPVPLKAMGRFNHEAVAVDPKSGIVFQTEDRGDGLIYRFIPNEKGNLQKGGKLQALAVQGQKGVDTRNWEGSLFPVGQPVAVEWIDMDEVESPNDDLRLRGFEKGAARFARGEGMWYGNGEIYFACTNGGTARTGQIFRYIPSKYEGAGGESENPGKLELFVEPNDKELLQHCDNLTISPWGDVVFVEDVIRPRIVGITREGEFYKIAENVGYESEMAGVVFSPSGKTLFANIQHVGLTVAITGPWT